jgi:hypothetical protein
MPGRRTVLVALALVVVLVVAGALLTLRGATPEGLAEWEGELSGQAVRFAYPEGWAAPSPDGRPSAMVTKGPRIDGLAPVVRAAAEPGPGPSFEAGYGVRKASSIVQLDGRAVTEEELDVPGAERAMRLDIEYSNGEGGQDRLSGIYAKGAEGFVIFTVGTASPPRTLDVEAILDSLSLRE